jgi:hypothetical protein
MRRILAGLLCTLVFALWAVSAQAFYGSVEYLDGRTLNGRIEVVNAFSVSSSLSPNLVFFVPGDNTYLMVALSDIKRIEFNWNYDANSVQPYYLRNKGDIKVVKISGEILEGAYFGSGQGVRELRVILDNTKQETVSLNDTKLDRYGCIKSISFNTINVPEQTGTVVVSAKTGKVTPINYRVSVEVGELAEIPNGPPRAKLKFGVGLTSLETKGEWIRVRTVGDIEVEGWIRQTSVTRGD